MLLLANSHLRANLSTQRDSFSSMWATWVEYSVIIQQMSWLCINTTAG